MSELPDWTAAATAMATIAADLREPVSHATTVALDDIDAVGFALRTEPLAAGELIRWMPFPPLEAR